MVLVRGREWERGLGKREMKEGRDGSLRGKRRGMGEGGGRV